MKDFLRNQRRASERVYEDLSHQIYRKIFPEDTVVSVYTKTDEKSRYTPGQEARLYFIYNEVKKMLQSGSIGLANTEELVNRIKEKLEAHFSNP